MTVSKKRAMAISQLTITRYSVHPQKRQKGCERDAQGNRMWPQP
jgi:hypothetical protein